jgi:D-glycero-D-manno-heptose 1,7-bisphosphate phosphatase
MAALNAIHAKMHRQLASVGARIEAVFFCPHAPEDGCTCRKPEPGLFFQIGQRFGVPLSDVPAVGNAIRHAQAATAAECPAHLRLTGQSGHLRDQGGPGLGTDLAMLAPELPPGVRAHADLSAFADWLLAQSAG